MKRSVRNSVVNKKIETWALWQRTMKQEKTTKLIHFKVKHTVIDLLPSEYN